MSKVRYGSTEERSSWIVQIARNLANILEHNEIPDQKLDLVAGVALARLKLFALFTKHKGFQEEREWRIVYMSDRDAENRLKPLLGYATGPSGVEPKLKYKVGPVDAATGVELSLDQIIAAISLGPTSSSPLAHRSVARMLELIGKENLQDRLFASSIPFRGI